MFFETKFIIIFIKRQKNLKYYFVAKMTKNKQKKLTTQKISKTSITPIPIESDLDSQNSPTNNNQPFVIKEKFEELVDSWIQNLNPKYQESSILSKERIEKAIQILNGNTKPTKMMKKWTKQFYIVSVQNYHILRRKKGNQKVVSRDMIFDIFYQKHSNDHPG